MSTENPYAAPASTTLDEINLVPGAGQDYAGRVRAWAVIAGLLANLCSSAVWAILTLPILLVWIYWKGVPSDPNMLSIQLQELMRTSTVLLVLTALGSVSTFLSALVCGWLAPGGELLNTLVFAGCKLLLVAVLTLLPNKTHLLYFAGALLLDLLMALAAGWLMSYLRRRRLAKSLPQPS